MFSTTTCPSAYQAYDTRLKYMVRHNLLPQQYLSDIPSSNISRWKKEADNKYVGEDIAAHHYEQLHRFAHDDNARQLMKAYWKITDTFRQVLSATGKFKDLLREHGETVVDTIQEIKPALGLDKALEWFSMSKATFHRWLMEVKVQCSESFFNDCVRFNPTQLTKDEVQTMHDILTDERFMEWKIKSIAYYCLRNNIVSASLSTWYRVRKLLGINRKRPRSPKSEQKTGIRASYPDEYWHADVSVFKLTDGVKAFLYLVVDNFSRYPLAWDIAKVKSGKIMRETLQKAREHMQQYKLSKLVNLVVDGGSENHNQEVEAFLNQDDVEIEKMLAGKDITFSNAMVEAGFYTIKNDYLYHRNINTLEQLKTHCREVIEDIGSVRPHGQLRGLTPFEAWLNQNPDKLDYFNKLQQARQKRLKHHQNTACNRCDGVLRK